MTARPLHTALVLVAMLWLFANSASAMLHPQLGRFMQRDPLGYVDASSLYAYERGQPVSHVDSFGTQTATTKAPRCCCKGNPADCEIEVAFLGPDDPFGPEGKSGRDYHDGRYPPVVFDGTVTIGGQQQQRREFAGGAQVHVQLKSKSGNDVTGCHLKQTVTDAKGRRPDGRAGSEPNLPETDYSSASTPPGKGKVYQGWHYWDFPVRSYVAPPRNKSSIPSEFFWQARVEVEESGDVRSLHWGWHVAGEFQWNNNNVTVNDHWANQESRKCPF